MYLTQAPYAAAPGGISFEDARRRAGGLQLGQGPFQPAPEGVEFEVARRRAGGLMSMGQGPTKPRIPAAAARAWVESVFVNVVGRPATADESQHYTNSLRIGALTFDEVLAQVRRLPKAPLEGPSVLARPRISVPSPTGPPGAGIPTWAWWAGGAVLAGLGLWAMSGGGR
jgi:hypothetical protein